MRAIVVHLSDGLVADAEAPTVQQALRAVAAAYAHLPTGGVHEILDHRTRARILTTVADRIEAALAAAVEAEADERAARKKAERAAERAARKAAR